MKLFLGLILLPTMVHAVSLGQYQSSPDGSSLQKFEIEGEKVSYEKASNFFDKKLNLSLGKFSSSYKFPEKDQTKLNATLTKVKDVDEFMKKKNSSFNDLSTKKPHNSFIMLEHFRLAQESDLYPEMKALYDSLAAQNWKQESGIKLSDDYKTLVKIHGGKEISREAFNFGFHCQKAEPPSVCFFKDLGILFVPKK